MGDRPGRKPYEDGKKSVEMFLNAVLCLPHVICSPVGWDCGRDNEATLLRGEMRQSSVRRTRRRITRKLSEMRW